MSADDFAALEHATPIVQVANGELTTTSMRIANGTALATPLQGNELLAAAVLESQKVIEARDARIHQPVAVPSVPSTSGMCKTTQRRLSA